MNPVYTSNSACATQSPLAPAFLLPPQIPLKKSRTAATQNEASGRGTLSSNTSQCLPDFGITGHFILRVVNIHCILNDCTIFIDFNLLCHSSDGKVVTVSVELNTEKQKHRLRTLKNTPHISQVDILPPKHTGMAELQIIVCKYPVQNTLAQTSTMWSSCSKHCSLIHSPSTHPHLHFCGSTTTLPQPGYLFTCSGGFSVQPHHLHCVVPKGQSQELVLEMCLTFHGKTAHWFLLCTTASGTSQC